MILDKLMREHCSIDNIWANFLLKEPAVGIELEYEEFVLRDNHISTEYWRSNGDGSLRNCGIELISNPILYNNIPKALEQAKEIVLKYKPIATERCGLHVHINMLPYTIGNLWSFVALYALMEPTIYTTYAVGRLDSMFAVPLFYNTTQLATISNLITKHKNKNRTRSGNLNVFHGMKYSALNLNSLSRFGTVEMRQPYCSVDFNAIGSWIDFVVRLANIGTSFCDPEEVIDLYENIGLEPLQKRLFGNSFQVDTRLQELAEDAAHWTCGYVEPTWQELSWDAPNMEEV